MRRRFATLDVFTDTRLAGNPLAVVLDSDGLDTPRMQAIAREFSLPETVFVLSTNEPAARARIRIFTPGRELPFAGHPTVGAAIHLGNLFNLTAPDTPLILDEEVGAVHCHVSTDGNGGGRARFAIPKLPEKAGYPPDTDQTAAALGLSPYDIGFDHFAPVCFSAGVAYTFVPVRDLDAIRRVRVDPVRFADTFGDAAYVFCRETADDANAFHARMFAPGFGIAEDPATGSAVAAFAGVLADFEPLANGEHPFVIEQGYEMGRPSLIRLTLATRDRRLTGATIAGDAVLVTEGTLTA
jgi:trans-2,3-dihydro-3-hydroxyanthranilate isomerase